MHTAMNDYFFVKQNAKLYRVAFSDVFYIEGLRNYCRIHTQNGILVTLKTLKQVQMLLPEKEFIRIHKSYIIAISKIFQVTKSEVCLGKNQRLPVGETFRPKLKLLITANLL